MTVTITIECDNAAFSPSVGHEVARILWDLAYKIESITAFESAYDRTLKLRDENGNTVGKFEVSE